MKRIVFLAASCALVAACSDSGSADTDGDGEVSAEEMAEAVADADIKPMAGQYRSTAELVSAEIPGAPANMVEMMKSGMAKHTNEYCLTEEEADKGFEKMAKESQDGDCTVDSFTVAGGDIDAKMTCSTDGKGKMNITLDGTGSPTKMDMTVTMDGSLPGLGQAKMVMRNQSERIGDCK